MHMDKTTIVWLGTGEHRAGVGENVYELMTPSKREAV